MTIRMARMFAEAADDHNLLTANVRHCGSIGEIRDPGSNARGDVSSFLLSKEANFLAWVGGTSLTGSREAHGQKPTPPLAYPCDSDDSELKQYMTP